MSDPWWSNLERWMVVDSRTGKRVSVVTFFSEEQVLLSIQEWTKRDARGKRPDIHELIPFLEPRRCD